MNVDKSLQIKRDKATLREIAMQRRAGLSTAERAKKSARAVEFFLEALDFPLEKPVALYWPIGDELDCKGLIERLQARDVLVGLPCIAGKAKPLVFRVFEGEENLVDAGFGTQSPREEAIEIVPDIIGLPLLAFDESGARLGYGGGFYDRTIAAMKNRPVLVGLAFETQFCKFVPTDDHDICLDRIMTDTGAYVFMKESSTN